MRIAGIVVLILLLGACGSTNIPEPTIRQALIQAGDSPAGLSGGLLETSYPLGLSEGLPAGGQRFWRPFLLSGESMGGVGVLIYASDADQERAYRAIRDGIGDGAEEIAGVGEQAHGIDDRPAELVFQRCKATVQVRAANASLEKTVEYAPRLDEILTPIVG